MRRLHAEFESRRERATQVLDLCLLQPHLFEEQERKQLRHSGRYVQRGRKEKPSVLEDWSPLGRRRGPALRRLEERSPGAATLVSIRNQRSSQKPRLERISR